MTDSFDFDAFISSPAQMDSLNTIFPVSRQNTNTLDTSLGNNFDKASSAFQPSNHVMMASLSDQGLDSGILEGTFDSNHASSHLEAYATYDQTFSGDVLGNWASNAPATHSTIPAMDANTNLPSNFVNTQQQPPFQPSNVSETTASYRNQIAAHHSFLLGKNAAVAPIPIRPFLSQSSPAVPRSSMLKRTQPPLPRLATVSNPPLAAMTLQERRRMSRQMAKSGNTPASVQSAPHGAKRGLTEEGEPSSSPVQPSAEDMASSHGAARGTVASFVEPVPPNVFNAHYQTTSGAQVSTQNKYSASGVDVLGILSRAIVRPNPRIALGPVDLSCSFTISDARHPEQPLIYASNTFCQLTGYSLPEILGKNCRFLQAPNIPLEAGGPRQHTDQRAVEHLKRHLVESSECQASLINYRKDGTPFINLVTVVPVSWSDPGQVDFLVGFQIDLIEQPKSVLERKEDGSYVVNYRSINDAPPSALLEDDSTKADADANKQAAIAADIYELICGDGDAKQWSRVLLENSHDLIYVLSLKGTFLYVSPSIKRILGYSVEEVIGKSISEFCHPSDVVPVFRELKDSTSNTSIAAAASRSMRTEGIANPLTKGGGGQAGPRVNLIFRMRHKHEGHCWIESTGKLHLEQGKGRKVVISSGRTRPVHKLDWEYVRQSAQVASSSFWCKMSTEGILLSSTGPISEVLGCDDRDVFGRHLLELTNYEAAPSLLQALRSGQPMSVSHLMGDGASNASPVLSSFYPSASEEGTLSTMFVHIQSASIETSWMTPNVAYPKAALPASLSANADTLSSVFAELSPSRASSWVFEMHQLKNVNRRLKDEIRALRRLSKDQQYGSRASVTQAPETPKRNSVYESSSTNAGATAVSHSLSSSPIKRRPDHGHGHRQHLRPSSSLSYLHANTSSTDQGASSSNSSTEISPAPQHRRDGRSGSGDGSDETALTSARSSASTSDKDGSGSVSREGSDGRRGSGSAELLD